MQDKVKQVLEEIESFQTESLEEIEQYRIKYLSKKMSFISIP